MQGLNLSRWAVSRPTLILFLMLAIGLGGLMSYQ
jgi:multidrug efflux pump subunit AcrB